jgi:hypothetical protein
MPESEIFLPSRSLLVFSSDAYSSRLHSVPGRAEDCVSKRVLLPHGVQLAADDIVPRGKRISLTIRYVPYHIDVRPKPVV